MALCGLGTFLAVFPARGQSVAPRPATVELRVADYEANTYVPSMLAAGKAWGPATAQIEVTYHGFPAEARQAFQLAVDLWERHIVSSVPIQVDATWESLEENVLGSAGPRLIANFTNRPVVNTWYPTALAEALVGQNFTGTQADVEASFNRDFENWYFGTDGRPPSGMFDLVSVVLHELGHGLGFTSSFSVDDGDAENGNECAEAMAGEGCWGLTPNDSDPRLFPFIFDHFVEDVAEVVLLDESVYPNPSIVLGQVLQSNDVFFDGTTVRGAHGEVPVDLFAPSTFELGSSLSHLDEITFPAGDPNSLMTPRLARAEVIHSPGAITCSIFRDIGWTLASGCLNLLAGNVFFVTLDTDVEGDDVRLLLRVEGADLVQRLRIEQSYFDDPFELVRTIASEDLTDGEEISIQLSDLEPGRYTFRVQQVGFDGSTSPVAEVEVFVELPGAFFTSTIHPNPFAGQAQFSLLIDTAQRVRIDVFDTSGRLVATLFEGQLAAEERLAVPFEADGLSSGIYFVRVSGVTFSTTQSAVVVR